MRVCGETRVSADLGHEASRRVKAGPAIRRAARCGSYTPPKKSGCFGPTVTTTGGSTRPRPRRWRIRGRGPSACESPASLGSRYSTRTRSTRSGSFPRQPGERRPAQSRVDCSDPRRRRRFVQIVQTKRGLHGCHLLQAKARLGSTQPLGTYSVLSPCSDEAPGDSGAVVTDLSMQPVRQGVDLDVILCRDSVLCDQGQDRAN